MKSGLTVIQLQVLAAVAEGYAARQGMKDRIRALNEWEIARRAGLTDASYAEYLTHPTRDEVGAALSTLQRLGLVSVWDHGAKYDTFVPTAAGSQLSTGASDWTSPGLDAARAASQVPEPDGRRVNTALPAPAASPDKDPIVDRLDEVIRLLRSIDAKLGGR